MGTRIFWWLGLTTRWLTIIRGIAVEQIECPFFIHPMRTWAPDVDFGFKDVSTVGSVQIIWKMCGTFVSICSQQDYFVTSNARPFTGYRLNELRLQHAGISAEDSGYWKPVYLSLTHERSTMFVTASLMVAFAFAPAFTDLDDEIAIETTQAN